MGRRTGCLIAIEGGEGSGKSTQAARLAAAIGAELTREPGGTAVGERVRLLLLDRSFADVDPLTELLLVAAQRAEHVATRIGPVLAAGRNVVTDRFSASTLAYQGYGRGVDLALVRQVCTIATGDLWPDLNILLEAPEVLIRQRRSPSPDRIEAADGSFHDRVASGFHEMALADPERFVIIDGTGSIDDVAAEVRGAVLDRLGL